MTITITPEETAKVLEGTAFQLAEWGWCRGTYHNGKGQACLVGAIWDNAEKATNGKSFASCPHPYTDRLYYKGAVIDAVLRAINYEVKGRDRASESVVINWNDDQRDKRKVIRMLRRTARKLRAA